MAGSAQTGLQSILTARSLREPPRATNKLPQTTKQGQPRHQEPHAGTEKGPFV
jgi:hypothetical protein